MEIDITHFFNTCAPMDYSASVAEIGTDAGTSTWRAACDDSEDFMMLDTEEKREAFRKFAQSAGFSEADDFATWPNSELNALLIQWISGDIREAGLDTENPDWQEFQNQSEACNNAGRLFEGTDGKIYFYIGS